MKQIEDEVYCDVHGETHASVTNPYDGNPTEYRDGKPVWLEYVYVDSKGNEIFNRHYGDATGRTITRPMEPECLPENWRKIWIGGPFE